MIINSKWHSDYLSANHKLWLSKIINPKILMEKVNVKTNISLIIVINVVMGNVAIRSLIINIKCHDTLLKRYRIIILL